MEKDRFGYFTEDERYALSEAIRAQLAVKQAAFEESERLKTSFATRDFGIDVLTQLLEEVGY